MTSFRGQVSLAKMMSPRGKLTALAYHPTNKENKSGVITIFYEAWCTLSYIENDAKIMPAHYTWKVAEKGFKMAFMMKNSQ